MKFSKLEQSATGTKDIGAFYGVNRTNKINDYQMSDMKNVDCESFPYLATRRARKLFYDENKMAVICHDTDITDDYKVTGVTESGGFVYRGEKLIDEGVSCDNSVTEFSGDYVFLPEQKYVRGKARSVREFPKPVDEYYFSGETSWRIDYAEASVGCIEISSGKICCINDPGGSWLREFISFFFSAYPGMFFSLKLFSSIVEDNKDNIIFDCDIPDDVYMVIDSLSIECRGVTYKYGEDHFSKDTINDANDKLYINFTARKIQNGEVYNISKHFKMFPARKRELAETSVYGVGLASVNLSFSTYPRYLNGINIIPIPPVMLFGEYFGGRLFACDNMGVDIYYSPSGNGSDKYDFTFGESLAGAGVVSCADSGKWTALKSYNGALYAFKKNGMYRIYSSDGLSFYMDKVADVGAVSRNAVAIVSDVMYFLSETGLYRFTGTYPEELPDNLGRRYTDGVLGGYDNKVYCSLSYSGGRELVVYDAQVNAYGVHDEFDAVNFVTYGGKLYGLDASSGCVYEMSGERESLEFSINTRKFFLGFDKKAINGIRLYFDYENQPGENFEVLVSYDGGEWEPCFKPITSGKLKYVPIKFKKCDELSVSIRGTGIFTLKGMTLSLYSSGDIKQNR